MDANVENTGPLTLFPVDRLNGNWRQHQRSCQLLDNYLYKDNTCPVLYMQ